MADRTGRVLANAWQDTGQSLIGCLATAGRLWQGFGRDLARIWQGFGKYLIEAEKTSYEEGVCSCCWTP